MNNEHEYRLWHPYGYWKLLCYAFFDWQGLPEPTTGYERFCIIMQGFFFICLAASSAQILGIWEWRSTALIMTLYILFCITLHTKRVVLLSVLSGTVLMISFLFVRELAFALVVGLVAGLSGNWIIAIVNVMRLCTIKFLSWIIGLGSLTGQTLLSILKISTKAVLFPLKHILLIIWVLDKRYYQRISNAGIIDYIIASIVWIFVYIPIILVVCLTIIFNLWNKYSILSFINFLQEFTVYIFGILAIFSLIAIIVVIIAPIKRWLESIKLGDVRSRWWLTVISLFPLSIFCTFLISLLNSSLGLDGTGIELLWLVFILSFTRLPLWPLEVIWGFLYWCWPKNRRILQRADISAHQQLRLIRHIYLDRYMWLPLPWESARLHQLIKKDKDLGFHETIYLAIYSNYNLNSTKVLYYYAEHNPLLILSYLQKNENKHQAKKFIDNMFHCLPPASTQVWKCEIMLEDLSQHLCPDPKQFLPKERQLTIHLPESAQTDGLRANVSQVIRQLQEIIAPLDIIQSMKNLSYVQEHYELYATIIAALECRTITAICHHRHPILPINVPTLYPLLLHQTFIQLEEVADHLRGHVKATSPVTRSKHLVDAQDILDKAMHDVMYITSPAGPFLALVIAHWQRLIVESKNTLTRSRQLRPIIQPYVIANPVVVPGFVGREDIMVRLESLWSVSGQRPSVVIYGHRRMGKSSILENLQRELFGPNTRIVNFNLQAYGLVPHTGILLHNCALALYDSWNAVSEVKISNGTSHVLTEPVADGFTAHDPYSEFNRFLKGLNQVRGNLRFIITLDEFEIIEERIRTGKFDPNIIDYLRGIITTQPWLTLAFAGLHTLQEMTVDYWHPLFGSVESIHVSFLTEGAMRRLLVEPSPDFAVDYDQDVLDVIYKLTHGQPYLTQLIGHGLVNRLNQQIFEEPEERDLRFTLIDVKAIIDSPDFYRTGSAYFQGIWAQASKGAPGQQTLLQLLASGGATTEVLVEQSKLSLDEVSAALSTLQRHDVLHRSGQVDPEEAIRLADEWNFSVELMRRWVARQAKVAGWQGDKVAA